MTGKAIWSSAWMVVVRTVFLGLCGGSDGGYPGFGGGGKGADGVVCVDGLLDECGEVLGAVVKSCCFEDFVEGVCFGFGYVCFEGETHG